jgi:thiol-disulfide isomerase/thioredoxin
MKRGAVALALALAASSCVHAPSDDLLVGRSVRPDGASRPVEFSFDSLDDRPVNSAVIVGKPTVLVFMTTWDLSSQAQIDFLVPMSKKDGGQVNYVMVALQEAKDRELVEVFTHGLGVTFLAALADKDVVDGGGPFGPVRAVPTMVILDRAARMVWRHVGLAKPEEIREGLSGL